MTPQEKGGVTHESRAIEPEERIKVRQTQVAGLNVCCGLGRKRRVRAR